MARLLVGDALLGETERLRSRIRQLFARLETQLRLILREWALTRVPGPELGSTAAANLLLSASEGRINQFVRSEFRALPTAGWDEQWEALERAVFRNLLRTLVNRLRASNVVIDMLRSPPE